MPLVPSCGSLNPPFYPCLWWGTGLVRGGGVWVGEVSMASDSPYFWMIGGWESGSVWPEASSEHGNDLCCIPGVGGLVQRFPIMTCLKLCYPFQLIAAVSELRQELRRKHHCDIPCGNQVELMPRGPVGELSPFPKAPCMVYLDIFGIFTNIYPNKITQMKVNIPAPWIMWVIPSGYLT